ncbi:hypothetical protein, conserved [Entamoeba dispar SAW760]|uniref:Leucine rich repeat containing protein BspA family protein n=1 Tax=Entamoeba dispar (strain ATCC PRA-260 / SAW760) TaxID=370354 RepID=B0EIN6_ENTDS|nr:uncharacterized protein EDI_176970 [Entamoeba dispar SAW760]EDR25610.1 hypothetical protein, conserved [Entamoeba dispar SAW760]|eukprot:EDR25610.1 hypothetical protein, conserved [Entamoeba dispar SAW760]
MEHTTKSTNINNKSIMKLGYNEIMIVSMYFDDIEDFINLEIGIKRFQGNMERFHFNPIPLNDYSRKLFPNIETFHIYNRSDEEFNDGKIIKKVMWCTVDYSTYLQEKEEWNECKSIIYTKHEREKYGNTIPPEVTSLGSRCFEGCYSLTSINIPTTISKIGDDCFRWCSSLQTIKIPSTVSEIGNGCFSGCSTLTSINIETMQFISQERIFINEPVLVSFSIPKNLQIINEENIEKKDINEFIVPATITKLGNWCFNSCSSLTSVNIQSSVSELGNGCFYNCTSLKSINIPSTIKEFGYWCFNKCSSLTSINIPSSVTSIGNTQFDRCSSLRNLEIDNLQFVSEERIFMNEPVLVSIKTPDNIEMINGKSVEKRDVNEFIIPTQVNELGKWCFYGCMLLTSINIPSSISKLGDRCFYECFALTSINIPSSITSFGGYCFYNCGCEEELKKNKAIPRICFNR